MKLYKGDKVMQMVDKDQLQDCLDAGWSRTEPVVEVEVDDAEVDDAEVDDAEVDDAEVDDAEVDDADDVVVPKKIKKIKPLKKRK
jgi:hypothetical protein